MSWELSIARRRQLQRAGVGAYVVLTGEAGKSGIATKYPIGQIVGFGNDAIGVRVRRIGQRSATHYSSIFWEPAPARLVKAIATQG